MTLKEIAEIFKAYMDESLAINWQAEQSAKAALRELEEIHKELERILQTYGARTGKGEQ